MQQHETSHQELSQEQVEGIVREAEELYKRGDYKEALIRLDGVLMSKFYPPGTFYLRAQCFERMGKIWAAHAFQAAQAETLIDPDHAGAAALAERMKDSMYIPGTDQAAGRSWATALRPEWVEYLEGCARRNVYRSIPMIKNVFDLAIYPMLLWDVKPRTIIEVGSFMGGSAVWMADMTTSWGLDTRIYSVDIMKVWTAKHERVNFIQGNGRDLGSVFSDEFLASMPRPLLVIEDADHSRITTKAVLEFFHTRLKAGEYIIVEDVLTMPREAGQALHDFLGAHSDDYLVDRHYCDFFGNNVTWCINGFLKRINAES